MRKLLVFILVPLMLSLTHTKSNTTLRWGLTGEKNNIVFDETEILVGEWLEYICYNNPQEIPEYIERYNVKSKHLTINQIQRLLSKSFPKHLMPDTAGIATQGINYLFGKRDNSYLMEYNGLNGSVLLPVDSLLFVQNKSKIKRDLNRPITGIKYGQALAFCKWRTRNDSLKWEHRKLNMDSLFSSYNEYFEFSLPSKEEFEMINTKKDSAINNYSSFNYKKAIAKSKKYPYKKCGETTVTPWHKLFNNASYAPSKFIFSGMQHVQGNVAEMSNIKGKSYGGSYFHFAHESYNNSPIKYSSPQPWLGFRCVGKRLKTSQKVKSLEAND